MTTLPTFVKVTVGSTFGLYRQDIKGLIALTGGKDRFTEKLDSMFTYIPAGNADLPLFSTGMIGQYAHGNEPSIM